MRAIRRQLAYTLDFAMCVVMNRIQSRHLLDGGSLDAFHAYIEQCHGLTPAEYFAAPPLNPDQRGEPGTGLPILRWETPVGSGFPANDRAHALLFRPHPGAPTVLMLHALASASDRGYRGWAARFNAAGWNACFVHLPYHYSRVPAGCHNGELAISPDLVRTAQGLRQGVAELRQLMGWLRAQGAPGFGLWATSYGGWIGALLLGVEPDFRFAALTRAGITQGLVERHQHLTFPMHVTPLCGADRVILAAGLWDQLARAEDIAALHRRWPGSAYISAEQGHFGFRMADECFRHLVEMKMLK